MIPGLEMIPGRKWSLPANDPRTGNDPQIGLRMIPGPEMVALSVMKEWNELKNLDSGFKLYIIFIFSYNATIIMFKCFACKFYNFKNHNAAAQCNTPTE